MDESLGLSELAAGLALLVSAVMTALLQVVGRWADQHRWAAKDAQTRDG